MNPKKFIAVIVISVACVLVPARQARALNLLITLGGTYSISTDGLVLGLGDAIICNGLVNSNAVTINIDATTPALGLLILPAIQISNNVPVTIRFSGASNLVLGNGADTSISVTGGGSLTVVNAGGATGGFVFSGNTNKVLTITGAVSGTDAVNKIVVGDNTLRASTAAVDLNDVTIGGPNAKLDIDVATTINTLSVTSGEDVDVDIASGLGLTVTDPLTLSGDSILELIAVTGGAAETLTLTGGLTLNGTSQLRFTNDGGALSGAVTSGSDSAVIDVNGTATISTLTPTNNIDLDIAAGKQLTVTNAVVVPAGKVVTFTGSNDASAETLTLAGGLHLSGIGAQLHIAGDNTTAQAVAGTVTVSTDGGVLNVDASATITAVDMASGSGDLTLEVAPGKTLTTTVDVNNNTLTIADTGTVSAVHLDTTDGTIQANANGTITTLSETAPATVHLGNGVNLTVTSPFNVGPEKLTLTGSGGGTQDFFTATVQLNNAASELEINGADADDIAGTTITVSADGARLDANINTAPVAVNMTSGTGDLTLEVAAGKTMTTTIDVNNNTLTLTEGGAVSTVHMDTAGGVLNVNENATVSTINGTQDFTIHVAAGKTLTATASIGANTLTLIGSGTISRVDATTGTITDNGGATVSDLRATFGTGGTFTCGGTGSGTITTLANALPGAGERFDKIGTGTLILASGFSNAFAHAAGVRLAIDGGTVVIGSPGTNDNLTLDDDGDEITVASGATLTTFGSLAVGAGGGNVNLDAAPGSTVNLSSNGGAETLTSAANDDFNLLGTVNINGADGDYAIADAFDYKFGNVNINTTGSLVNNQPGGEIKFVPNSVVTLTGAGTFHVSGQASGTAITLDTTTGAGTFVIDRGDSGNLLLDFVTLNHADYDSGRAAVCEIDTSHITFGTGNVNWQGDCGGGGGGGGGTAPTGDGTGTGTDGGTPPPPDSGSTDTSGGDTIGTPSTPLPSPVSGAVGEDGTLVIEGAILGATVQGLSPGTPVSIRTDEMGVTTLTIGDAAAPLVLAAVENAQDGSRLLVSSSNGVVGFSLTQGGTQETITVDPSGLSQEARTEVLFSDDGTRTVTAVRPDGNNVAISAKGLDGGYNMTFTSNEDRVGVTVSDPVGSSMAASAEASASAGNVDFTIEYEPTSRGSSGNFVTGFPGLQNEASLGGSVRFDTSAQNSASFYTVSLFYNSDALSAQVEPQSRRADLSGKTAPTMARTFDETQLRMVRFDETSGRWVAPGESDQGTRPPTYVLGQHGDDTDKNQVWAHVATLGRFAVGFPADSASLAESISTGTGTFAFDHRFCGSCGAGGSLPFPAIGVVLLGLRFVAGRRRV